MQDAVLGALKSAKWFAFPYSAQPGLGFKLHYLLLPPTSFRTVQKTAWFSHLPNGENSSPVTEIFGGLSEISVNNTK